MGWIVRNPELKRLLCYSILLIIAVSSVLGLIFNMLHHDLQRQLIQRDHAVIGRLTSRHPQWAAEIINAFYKKAKPEQAEKGALISARYGYTSQIPLRISPLIEEFNIRTYGLMGSIVGIGFLILLGVVFLTFKNVYRQITFMADASRQIVEPTVRAGAFPKELPSVYREGDLGNLAFMYNRMTDQLERNLGWLEEEKGNLKKLVSDISHQLKTPLASIKMYNELLQEEIPDGTEENIQREF